MCPAHGKRSIVFGSMLSMTIAFASWPRTSAAAVLRAGPTSAASATSRFASVADRPQMRTSGRSAASRASASSVCTPRLVDRSSCHSSTTTASRCAKRSRQSARARNSVRLSGVVTSAVGSRLVCWARAGAAVSPVRTATVQCGRSAAAASASARPVSAASARSGVSHRSVSGGGSPAAPWGPRTSGGTAAASVLPMPVGACTRPERPAACARQTSSWNREGRHPARREPGAGGKERIRSGRGRVRNRSIIGRYSQRGAHAREFSARSRVGRR